MMELNAQSVTDERMFVDLTATTYSRVYRPNEATLRDDSWQLRWRTSIVWDRSLFGRIVVVRLVETK
jgi:hypothetical protein